MANTKVSLLTADEIDFVSNDISGTFLRSYGTSAGFRAFCSLVKDTDFKCPGKVGRKGEKASGLQSKEAYATYLKNARMADGRSLLQRLINDYNTNLDPFTKYAMRKSVGRGDKLQKPQTFNVGCFTRFTAGQLREIADVAGVSVKGNKVEVCAKLQEAGVPLDALWGTAQTITLAKGSTADKTKVWKAYLRKTLRKPGAQATYSGVQSADRQFAGGQTWTAADEAALQEIVRQARQGTGA